jgi:dTDP-4-amino-4,6-dideoxygalactose transaminase
MASLDFERAYDFSVDGRREIFSAFCGGLDSQKFHPFVEEEGAYCVPLAAPILCRTKNQKDAVETYLRGRGVMTRPIIGGSLLAHTAFKGYGSIEDFPVARWAHECGLYVGLHSQITKQMAQDLALELNDL